jgi:hypothetical protein
LTVATTLALRVTAMTMKALLTMSTKASTDMTIKARLTMAILTVTVMVTS